MNGMSRLCRKWNVNPKMLGREPSRGLHRGSDLRHGHGCARWETQVTSGIALVAALSGAMCFAWAAILQQESAQEAPEDKALRLSLLVELLRCPKWLAGVSVMVAGYGLQVVALARGPVALVQPLIITELAFAVPLAIWRCHRTAGSREWAGIGFVVVGISGFLLMATPESGNADAPDGAWLFVLLASIAILASVIHFASRASGPVRAMILGAAAGLAFGLLAALTKSMTQTAREGVGQMLASWQLYAVIVVGIGALVLSQSAYQAGPLAYSMPVVAILEPLVAVLLGVLVLDEQILLHGLALLFELLAVIVACTGIGLLTTSRTVLSIYEESTRAAETHERCVGDTGPRPHASPSS
jgi:drug/metabolite transporter (DMT)-like permease